MGYVIKQGGKKMTLEQVLEKFKTGDIDWQELDKVLQSSAISKNPEFTKRIINTNLPVLGVYIPTLRKIAKTIPQDCVIVALDTLNCDFYEKTLLKALLIGRIKDCEVTKKYLLEFLPQIDNWSTCDLLCGELKIVKGNKDYFSPIIDELLISDDEFVRRVGIVLLMKYYLDSANLEQTLRKVGDADSEKYYISMALAWLLAEAYARAPNLVVALFDSRKISQATMTRAVGKIFDSFRITKEQKMAVKKYR